MNIPIKNNKFSLKTFPENAKIHFIALGGIGMSALARILQQAGYRISGSDLNKNHLMEYFEAQGADVYTGHSAENLQDCHAVIKSSAIKEDNPEYRKALAENIPVIHRAELLNSLMIDLGKTSIGVTGTHGKTSAAGMIATIFHESGREPSFAIGGEIPQLKTNSVFGEGEFFISELDESDGTIELYSPEICVITNLELEHTDYYKDGFSQLLGVFERFINSSPDSKIIINTDDSGNIELMDRAQEKSFLTYSLKDENADYFAEIIQTVPEAEMKVFKKGGLLGEVKVGVPGIHNISNALGAIAAAIESGVGFEEISSALSKFTGMKKRFQTVGFAKNARVIDDYAHHPTEIKAAIKTAKEITEFNEKGRVVAVFQPHKHTRFAKFWDEFLNSFDEADIVYVCDVFSAEQAPIENVNSENFSRQLKRDNVIYVKGDLDRVADEIVKEIAADDMVLTMGAGTITKLGRIIINKASS